VRDLDDDLSFWLEYSAEAAVGLMRARVGQIVKPLVMPVWSFGNAGPE
jgi:hypothetical protein